MIKRFGFTALVGLAALCHVTKAPAQHHHHGGWNGSGIGIRFGSDDHDSHRTNVHFGHDDHHDYGRRNHHSDVHHTDVHHSNLHHSDWHYVVPHYDNHYHGTYYVDGGVSYYVPRRYVTQSQSYVVAKPVQLEFGGYAHVDDLAGRLEQQANQLCLELNYNYRHNADFNATYREAYQILAAAKYIHEKEHQGDRAEVARRLDEVDGLLHHVQEDVARWSRRQRRQIGQGGAQAKLDLVEATLHHLMHDVGVQGHDGVSADSVSAELEVAPPPAN